MKEEKIVYWKDIEKEMKREQFIAKTKQFGKDCVQKAKDGLTWCVNNKELALMGGAIILEGSRMARKCIDSNTRRKAEKRYYDRSSMSYIKLKRKLTENEKRYAAERHMSTGETYTEIYKSMGVL